MTVDHDPNDFQFPATARNYEVILTYDGASKVAHKQTGTIEPGRTDPLVVVFDGVPSGGMVTVEANGQGVIQRIKIDPSVVNPADVEMLEDLVLVALSEAQKRAQEKSQELTKSEMGKLTGGLPLPFKLPF